MILHTHYLSIIDRVNSSEIEVGLVTINRNMPKIIESNIFEKKQLIAVIAKDHDYWSQSANNRIRYLNNIPVLSAPAGNEHHNILNSIMHKFQITSTELSGFSTLEVIRKLVENGFGWALITKDMMSDKLKEIPTIKDSIYVSNACIYSKKNQLSRPAIAFIEMCKKYGSLD
ncbi:LysR family transcriptional regulator substrate-binding protein [Francisella sp. 19S2-10]|uniref:LysR family transcriptional regulator substrate-binding protein n=1 Tax=Francisella sp. 19S2-10 TaxID=3087176 RepID=UPI002E358CE6|nr:LysR family transcriptional regulator substrate-binding protein [Francisella sp. 19S2-10]MED7830414.1 LysR family transcriptional regulator substrate-binding protein [Francisella sp. 19S2-10]